MSKIKAMDLLEESPVIAAVKDEAGLNRCFESECQVVFLLYANLCDLAATVKKVKEHGKIAIVHADLVQGLSSKEAAIDFIRNSTEADGIISTKPSLVRRAMELGLYGILRTFIIDSMAMTTTKKQLDTYHPDMLELMPGILPSALKEMRSYTKIPLIAGGLIASKQDVMSAFDAGADAVSTTCDKLWFI